MACTRHLEVAELVSELSQAPDSRSQLLLYTAQGDVKYSKKIKRKKKKSNQSRKRWRYRNQAKNVAEIYTLYILLNTEFYYNELPYF